MTNNKKFIAAVTLAFFALMGSAATAEARPFQCGIDTSYCHQKRNPTLQEQKDFQETAKVAGKAALRSIQKHLGLPQT
jgi:outer membrane biogenesis lipoprotein LolB